MCMLKRNYMLKRNHNLVTEVYIQCILINFAIIPYRKNVSYPIYVIRNSIYFMKTFVLIVHLMTS